MESNIVDYIRANDPTVEMHQRLSFTPTNALGFVISDEQLILGYISKNGVMCKLADPVDLKKLDTVPGLLENVIQKIPLMQGFTAKDKERILRLFSNNTLPVVSGNEQQKVYHQLHELLTVANTQLDKCTVMYDTESRKHMVVMKDMNEKISTLTRQYTGAQQELDMCKKALSSSSVQDGIHAFQQQVDAQSKDLANKDAQLQNLNTILQQLQTEKQQLEEQLQSLLQNETNKLQQLQGGEDLLSDYVSKQEQKQEEIRVLQHTSDSIASELQKTKDELEATKKRLEQALVEQFDVDCAKQILRDKDTILAGLQEYNTKWQTWATQLYSGFDDYKKQLVRDLKVIKSRLQQVTHTTREELQNNEARRLSQHVADIEAALQTVISEQLVELNKKDEQIKLLQAAGISTPIGSNNDLIKQLEAKEEENKALREELHAIKLLLADNKNTVVSKVDYTDCYKILQNFMTLNNVLYRKQTIIQKLDDIIYNNKTVFANLDSTLQTELKETFEQVKTEIGNHIKFLDLDKYLKSPNFEFLKNKSTQTKVPPEFCTDLTTILEYWNTNVAQYHAQDTVLTNIYEDLSGAVRVYVRIKPLSVKDARQPTVQIHNVSNRKEKAVDLLCPTLSVNGTFGQFYGVFEDTFTNQDIYTGVPQAQQQSSMVIDFENLVESIETTSPGMHSVFTQVANGYSIVLFGYGSSGSGKSFSLLGSKNIPGLMHYGLANIHGLKNIKLKYLFEQYIASLDVFLPSVRGRIHNLVREVPQMREYAKDETIAFKRVVPDTLNLDNLRVDDLYMLTSVIDTYRVTHGRIKKTPNNPVSSRSHLFFVFEVTMENGNVGYITIVDTAGRESPQEIFKTFINTDKTSLGTVMNKSYGIENIEKYKKPDIDDAYTPTLIQGVLREGFYINETINHLVWFFNKKNYKITKTTVQPTDLTKYSVDKYYVNPVNEANGKLSDSNNCLTIPILQFLDTLASKTNTVFKPTKYIMLCNVRQEETYCGQTLETLRFAQSIAST